MASQPATAPDTDLSAQTFSFMGEASPITFSLSEDSPSHILLPRSESATSQSRNFTRSRFLLQYALEFPQNFSNFLTDIILRSVDRGSQRKTKNL